MKGQYKVAALIPRSIVWRADDCPRTGGGAKASDSVDPTTTCENLVSTFVDLSGPVTP